jgi:two-component system catabolic regulation response regulator CreB
MTPVAPSILIVEDEPGIVENIRYALETEGFDTVCHYAGGQVIPLLSARRIDLIILDIGLPDVNGLELCKEIRKDHDVPIIFLTARTEEIDRVVGLEIGADDYVVKPFSPRELSARVKAVLRRTGDSEHGARAKGSLPFQMDESRRRISYFGQELELSRYEYAILKTFLNLPGHVFTRDRLMELVWDEPEVSLDRTVDAHIKNIRRKLKELRPDLDPILTHRGVGYSLRDDL